MKSYTRKQATQIKFLFVNNRDNSNFLKRLHLLWLFHNLTTNPQLYFLLHYRMNSFECEILCWKSKKKKKKFLFYQSFIELVDELTKLWKMSSNLIPPLSDCNSINNIHSESPESNSCIFCTNLVNLLKINKV